MTKEEKFKNKSIKKKVNDAFNMIFRLYFTTVALACLGLILLWCRMRSVFRFWLSAL